MFSAISQEQTSNIPSSGVKSENKAPADRVLKKYAKEIGIYTLKTSLAIFSAITAFTINTGKAESFYAPFILGENLNLQDINLNYQKDDSGGKVAKSSQINPQLQGVMNMNAVRLNERYSEVSKYSDADQRIKIPTEKTFAQQNAELAQQMAIHGNLDPIDQQYIQATLDSQDAEQRSQALLYQLSQLRNHSKANNDVGAIVDENTIVPNSDQEANKSVVDLSKIRANDTENALSIQDLKRRTEDALEVESAKTRLIRYTKKTPNPSAIPNSQGLLNPNDLS